MWLSHKYRLKVTYLENNLPRQSHKTVDFPFLIHRTGQIEKVHCHDHDFWELVFVFSGRGICISAGETFEFHSHQLILTPPFTTHEFQSHDKGHHEQISLSIYPEFLEQASIARVQLQGILSRIEKFGCFAFDVPGVDVAQVKNSLELINHEFLFQRADFESIISLEIARLLITANRVLFDQQTAFAQFNDLPHVVLEALKQIEQYYHKISNGSELLQLIHIIINQRYFIRIFKQHVGFTPIQYLNRVRIEKSCSLLLHTSLPISHVALDVGFGDLRFFNRQFKRFVGMTPKGFCQSAKKNPTIIKKMNRFNF